MNSIIEKSYNPSSAYHWYSRAWHIYKYNCVNLIIPVIIVNMPVWVIWFFGARPHVGEVCKLYQLFCGSILYIGCIYYCLQIVRGKIAHYKYLIAGFKCYPKLLFTIIIFSFVVTIGFLIFVIPGLVVFITYFFSMIVVIDKRMSILESFKLSSMIIKHKKIQLLGLCLLYMPFALIQFLLNRAIIYDHFYVYDPIIQGLVLLYILFVFAVKPYLWIVFAIAYDYLLKRI